MSENFTPPPQGKIPFGNPQPIPGVQGGFVPGGPGMMPKMPGMDQQPMMPMMMPPMQPMPMNMTIPPFMNMGSLNGRSNELILSNVHQNTSDQLIYQLLEKYRPSYVSKKLSRAQKPYYKVGFSSPKDAETVEREFKYFKFFGYYLKVLWPGKNVPDLNNSIVLKNIKDPIDPKLIENFLNHHGFKVYIIHLPTSEQPGQENSSSMNNYKPNGYAFVQFKPVATGTPDAKGPEEAVKLLDGYAFPELPDVKLIAQKYDPLVKEKKTLDLLYCTGFPPEIASESPERIASYLKSEVLEGIITSEDDVSIRVYKKNPIYATMKFTSTELANKVMENFNPDGAQSNSTEPGTLVVRYIKSKAQLQKEKKDGVMHRRCVFVKDIKPEIDEETFTEACKGLHGYERVAFFRNNSQINRKCSAVSFISEEMAHNAISEFLKNETLKSFEVEKAPGERTGPFVTPLMTKTQKMNFERTKKASPSAVRRDFNNRMMDRPMGMGPMGPMMGSMPGPFMGQGMRQPRPYPPRNMGGPQMQQFGGGGGFPRGGPRHEGGFNNFGNRPPGGFRGGPRPGPMGPVPGQPSMYMNPNAPQPAPVQEKTWEDEIEILQNNLKSGGVDEISKIFEEKGPEEMRKIIGSKIIGIFAKFYNKKSDEELVGKAVASFLSHIDSNEDLEILHSNKDEWKESMAYIQHQIENPEDETANETEEAGETDQ